MTDRDSALRADIRRLGNSLGEVASHVVIAGRYRGDDLDLRRELLQQLTRPSRAVEPVRSEFRLLLRAQAGKELVQVVNCANLS